MKLQSGQAGLVKTTLPGVSRAARQAGSVSQISAVDCRGRAGEPTCTIPRRASAKPN